jgi:predicted alpha/beta superfamily hydrolase
MKWNDDLTPWKVPALNLKEEEFKGKARDFLSSLLSDLFVNTEQSLRLNHPTRHLIGISLSGLFALWASTVTGKFNSVASISGSLWYDGFVEWLKEQELHAERYFLSLGDKEMKVKNERLSSVGSYTEAVLEIIKDKYKEVTFVTDEGNHFEFFRERLEKALTACLGIVNEEAE